MSNGIGIMIWSENDFKKRRNSTKVPLAGGLLIQNVILKEATSIEKPTFVLDWSGQTGDIFSVAEVKFHGEYYFVDDIKVVRNKESPF